ncbi:Alpha-mannosidase [Colletotrichum sp. SAR 10_77]|nr:Alpha-mannosidase [Colletotrichum sp. SAR 10_77]
MCGHGTSCGHQPASSTSSYPLRAPAPVGKRVNKLYRDRTANFYSPGQWEKVNLLSMLHLAVCSEPPNLQLSVWDSPGTSRPSFSEATAQTNEFRKTQIGESFGPSWSTHWFRVEITIPEEMRQMEHLELHWDCSNEATVWTAQGEPLQGLTGRGERIEWVIPEAFKDGEMHTVFIEMACNGMFGNAAGDPIFKNNANGDAIQPPDPNKYFVLAKAEIVAVDVQARKLHTDIEVIHQAAQEFPEDSWEQREALNIATRIINTFRAGDRESILKSRKIAEEYLGPDTNSDKVFSVRSEKFKWLKEGYPVALDGSQVICHMPPAKTYCADATFDNIKKSMTQHRTLDQDHTSLLAFGKGDGGGGPTWQQIERLRRLRGLADTTGLLPRVHLGGTPDDFFDKLEEKAHTLPTWHGELYFELHRGTYTTQATTKNNNRRAEFLLRDLELLATIASIHDPSYKYPKKELDEMWEGVLLCQFHDCLPGTAIGMCYDDSDKIYSNVLSIRDTLLKDIYSTLSVFEGPESRFADDEQLALNTLAWPRKEVLFASNGSAVIAEGDGTFLSIQDAPTATAKKLVTVEEISEGVFKMQNSRFAVIVERGCITSLYDYSTKRQVLAGKANQFVIFDDKPIYWQAWDVEVFHLETREELHGSTTSILEDGPLKVSVVTETKISDVSSIKTTISLGAAFDEEASPSYVECTAEVDWHETMKFLKVEFPVDVRHHEASYDTQYGVIRRPTHYNTSWDMAKFEVCSHKYADLSEYGYGVSILNDSKYGFATVGNTMRLSLLRSAKAPDDQADMGKHTIRWAILPHEGPLGPDTVRAAFNFNNPSKLMWMSADSPFREFPIVLDGDKNLVLDTIKRGEDDEDVSNGELPVRSGKSVIVRIYESLGGRGRATVQTRWNLQSVHKTNLLEDDEADIPLVDGKFEVDLGPFQLQTFRLVLAG